jgi:hypothetical protein
MRNSAIPSMRPKRLSWRSGFRFNPRQSVKAGSVKMPCQVSQSGVHSLFLFALGQDLSDQKASRGHSPHHMSIMSINELLRRADALLGKVLELRGAGHIVRSQRRGDDSCDERHRPTGMQELDAPPCPVLDSVWWIVGVIVLVALS